MTARNNHPPEPTSDTERRLLLKGSVVVWASLSSLALSACGGGDAAADAAPAAAALDAEDPRRQPLGGVDSGGTGMPVQNFYSAAISAVNPVLLGGVVFDLAQCVIVDADGLPLAGAALAPGMSSRLSATKPLADASGVLHAKALSLRVAEELWGPVSAWDAAAQRLTLLGQTVRLSAQTQLDRPATAFWAGLAAGAVLRVWGQLDVANGSVRATRAELVAGADAWVVRGRLLSVDRTAARLRVGGLTVQATTTAAWPQDLAVGDIVRLRVAASGAGAGVALLSVQHDALVLPNAHEAEIEGTVTQVSSALLFAVDGVAVDASAVLPLPTSAPPLGARVEAHGSASDGVLRARTLQIEIEDALIAAELEGAITAVDSAASSFVLRGVSVAWSSATLFVGGGASLLRARRQVAVRGLWNADYTQVLAQNIHIEV